MLPASHSCLSDPAEFKGQGRLGSRASSGLHYMQAAHAGRRHQQGAGRVVVVRAEKRTVVIGLAADSGKLVTGHGCGSLGPEAPTQDCALCASDLQQPWANLRLLGESSVHPLGVTEPVLVTAGCGKSTFMRRMTSVFGGSPKPPAGEISQAEGKSKAEVQSKAEIQWQHFCSEHL